MTGRFSSQWRVKLISDISFSRRHNGLLGFISLTLDVGRVYLSE